MIGTVIKSTVSTHVTHHSFFEGVIDIISKMPSRTVGCNKLFAKYTVLLHKLSEAMDIYEKSFEAVASCLDFKDFEDLIY